MGEDAVRNGSIVILTGAGISAESGIKTFRDHNGLWENHRIEDVASPGGFRRNPDMVQSFYNARRSQLLSPEIKPNAAHAALAELEARWPDGFLLVTQNVDDLHERAGSKALIHMHGELLKIRCTRSEGVFECREPITKDSTCECCGRTETLRPHIVWFGEIPFEVDAIQKALSQCSLFAAIGTSGQVYPAAGFVNYVPESARRIEINIESTDDGDGFFERMEGPATKTVPQFVKELLEN
jgi:NAD-dependent deacetylase